MKDSLCILGDCDGQVGLSPQLYSFCPFYRLAKICLQMQYASDTQAVLKIMSIKMLN